MRPVVCGKDGRSEEAGQACGVAVLRIGALDARVVDDALRDVNEADRGAKDSSHVVDLDVAAIGDVGKWRATSAAVSAEAKRDHARHHGIASAYVAREGADVAAACRVLDVADEHVGVDHDGRWAEHSISAAPGSAAVNWAGLLD